LTLAGRETEAWQLAQTIVPVDVYEWLHLFEALLRLGRLGAIDLSSLLYSPPLAHEHPWSALARRRMRADFVRITGQGPALDFSLEYRTLLDAYDRAGLPVERMLTRMSYARWLTSQQRSDEAAALQQGAVELAQRFQMRLFEEDARQGRRP
jgi:hypothetical protein